MASSSSSSSSSCSQWIYDVFLSFRGEETRKNFVEHLYVALQQKGIYTFEDDKKLERGKSISPELLKAIKRSRFAVIVFSKNYASSSGCLEELVEIIECNKKGQTVLPVFYNVDPSEVRKQTGNFAEAFAKHDERFCENKEKVQRWRAALVEAANLSGWDLNNIANGHEAKFIQEIVQEIFKKLRSTIPLSVAKYEVGLVSRVNKVISLLNNSSKNVHIVGICGAGGIGKTTIAKAVYNQIFDQFESRCFLSNVKEEASKQHGLTCLQKQLLNGILTEEDSQISNVDYGICVIKRRLRYKKVLVVLDDVDHLKQLESLAGGNDWFGFESTIIITTRDERLLVEHKIDHEIYKVDLLNDNEALELFSWHAFTKSHPAEDFLFLSWSVIKYAQGLPLALKVLGSFLFKRSRKEWEHELDNLKRIPNREIHEVLKISFDGLNDTEKDLFLDIACFFRGCDIDYVMDILGSSGFHPRISILIERNLVISNSCTLWMHDLIQEMGKEIVRQESVDDPGKRSRLWFHEDIYKVFRENTATESIKGIVLNMPDGHLLEELCVHVDAFEKMKKLKLLKLNGIRPSERLTYLSHELCYLDWDGYPARFFPSNFYPKNLVHLRLHHSQIKQISMGIKFLEKLKFLDLSHSLYLDKTPDLSCLPCLENLNLEGCSNLVEVHLSNGVHERLVRCNLSKCKNLRILPRSINLKNLQFFTLAGCSKLEKFSEIQGNMVCLEELHLDNTAIKDLPSSIEHLEGLRRLSLEGCQKLKSVLTNIFSKMKDLEYLDMGRTAIKKLPSSIAQLSNLEELYVSGNDFQSPSSKMPISLMQNTFLRKRTGNSTCLELELLSGLCTVTRLSLRHCNLSEESFPKDIGKLSSMRYLILSENKFACIPECFIQLTSLMYLYLEHCTSLRSLTSLPSSIRYVNAHGCRSLERYQFPPIVENPDENPDDREFIFTECHKLDVDERDNMPSISSQSQLQELGIIILPGRDIPHCFTHRNEGSSFSLRVDLPSYENVKGIVVCAALEIYHGIDIPQINFNLEINGYSMNEWFTYNDLTAGDNAPHHIFLKHKTEYNDECSREIRPIKSLMNNKPTLSTGTSNTCDGCHIQASVTLNSTLLKPSSNREAKVHKLGIHLVMEEQAETSKQG